MSKYTSTRRNHPLAARIKRLMQKDDEVGRIASVTPTLISRALELFLKRLCTNIIDQAKEKKSRAVCPCHLKAYIYSDNTLDFLRPLVKDVPDVGTIENTSTMHPNAKRHRLGEGGTGLRGKGRGRGEICGGRMPKRRCVPAGQELVGMSAFAQQPCSESPAPPTTTRWAVSSTNSSPTIQPIATDKATNAAVFEVPGRNASLPIMTAVRSHESHVDPSHLPRNLQRALLVSEPDNEVTPQSLTMPPVSMSLSISDIELGVRATDLVGLRSVTSEQLASTPPPPIQTVTIATAIQVDAENDNYDLDEDIAEEDVKLE